jgi:hypothetical protein
MAQKVASHRHIRKPHAHVFNFNPLEWLSPADAKALEERLIAQRGSTLFPSLHAWRLRLDPRRHDKQKSAWAVEVPLGTFSTFSEALRKPGDELEGRLRLFKEIREHVAKPFVHDPLPPTPEELAEAAEPDHLNTLVPKEHKRPGRKPQGFSPTASVFERDGVTYYREEAIAELRIYQQNPEIFWALHCLLERAKEKPELITGVPYGKNGRLPRLRPFVPLDRRKIANGRPVRGPDWSEEETAKIRLFFSMGYLLTAAQFDEQEQSRLAKGLAPRNREEWLAKNREYIVHLLGDRRSIISIERYIHRLNGQTLKKYTRNGKIPASEQKAFRAEYLGIPIRLVWRREYVKHTWLLVARAQGNGPVFIAGTQVLAMRVGALVKSLPLPMRVMAIVRSDKASIEALQASLAEHRQLNDWFAPTPAVLAVLAEQQRLSVAALAKGDKAYLLEARRLRNWLDWSLLKTMPDEA